MQTFFYTACLLLLVTQSTPAQSQVYGCKDPGANNYNPSATVNDGSCTYNSTSYTSPIKVDAISNVLTETSGLQMAGGFLWSFNDGGGAAAIYRIDTASAAILQTVNLGGAANVDWEDIAFDGTHLYIGDFGNNAAGARTDLKIYKFPLNAIPDYVTNATVTIPAGQVEVINFSYRDQVPVVATGPNNTKFDCEAMIVDGGKIHLFTKNWVNTNTTHYVINATKAGTYIATPVETLSTGYLVTAADKAPNTNVVMLLGYQTSIPGNHFLHLLSDYSGGLYFNGNKRRLALPSAADMGQAEGIAFRNDTYGYISNEKFVGTVGPLTLTVNQKLRSFNAAAFLPAYVLPLQLQQFAVAKRSGQNLLSWRFSGPVKELVIQHSTDRQHFTNLQAIGTSAGGRFSHQPVAGTNCYRLGWKTSTGTDQYSDLVCVNNDLKTSFSNILLRDNGELSFVFTGADNDYSFRLIATDGRVIAQTRQRLAASSSGKISFDKNLAHSAVLLLEATSGNERESVLLRVE